MNVRDVADIFIDAADDQQRFQLNVTGATYVRCSHSDNGEDAVAFFVSDENNNVFEVIVHRQDHT